MKCLSEFNVPMFHTSMIDWNTKLIDELDRITEDCQFLKKEIKSGMVNKQIEQLH